MTRMKIRGHYGNCITWDKYECPHCSCYYVDEADTLDAQKDTLLAALNSLADSLESIRLQVIGLEGRVTAAIAAAKEK